MKRLLITIILASTVFAANAVAGPSAKFAATWTKGIGLASVAVVSETDADDIDFDLDAGYTLATIKVPQDKELLVGVSANIGLVTDTSIKGRNGGAAKAIAGAGAGVIIFAVPTHNGSFAVGEPGFVVLNARVQVLEARLGGVIESCTVPEEGPIIIATDCTVTDEEIGLILATLSANHFNFVLPNMDQGEYDIVAFFVTGALAAVDIDDASVSAGGSVTGAAFAAAFVGKTMVTLQQVRAAEGGVIESEIEEL